MKIVAINLALIISSCSLMFRGDGGISLVGEVEGNNFEVKEFQIIEGCFYDVLDSKNRPVYSNVKLGRFGNKISINLTVEPRKEDYTVKIYCDDKLVKEVITSSADTEPTDFGVIQLKIT